MAELIGKLFSYLAIGFDKIPVLNKVKGLRTILGFVGLGVIAGLNAYGVGDVEIKKAIEAALLAWTALALNAKGRE